MTTINNQEDLLRALTENPEWKAAVRQQIVGDELMNLPPQVRSLSEQLSMFIGEMRYFTAEMRQFTAEQKQFNDEQRATNARLELRVDAVAQDVSELKDDVSELKGKVDSLEHSVADLQHTVGGLQHSVGGLEHTVGGLTDAVDRLRDDVGEVKGYYARNWTGKYAETIVLNMGLAYTGILPPAELARMTLTAAAGRRLTGNQRSFQNADLIIEALDGDTPCYVAVEVSFTADARDTNRALRNASMLTEYTGRPARAAIASVRNDHSITWQIESGAVHWYQIDEDDIEPD